MHGDLAHGKPVHGDPGPGRSLRIALTQWRATRDVASNLAIAKRLIRQAGREGAELVLLPENGLMLGSNAEMRAAALAVDSAEIGELCAAAREAAAPVVLGGFKHRGADGAIHNTALVIDRQGRVIGGYDKIHTFNATVGGQTFAASTVEQRGGAPAILVVNGVRIGLTICYDVRFPELYRRLALEGAEVVVVPSAFTQVTGLAHWEVLLRARAIENGNFIVASATIRGTDGKDAFETYGHALAVDPWGEILADLGLAGEACRVVTLDLAKVARVRQALPVLRSVLPAAYAAALQVIQA